MSRGLSETQNRIMARLRLYRAVPVDDLLREFPGRSDNVRRAIRSLVRRGLAIHGLVRMDGAGDVETLVFPSAAGGGRKP